jgi:hypothetical protein
MPATLPIAEPISTLVGGGAIAARVQRLIDDAPRPADRSSRAPWLAAVSAAAIVVALEYAPLLETVHRATEILVHRLP